ncbi:hypothetical protein FISHEDRAFT_23132, partial [Fistulina hepatica ATCC 64428]
LARFLARDCGLTRLPAYLSLLVASFVFFTFVHLVGAPVLSRWLFPVSWSSLKGQRGRNNWSIHIVSFVHVSLIIPLCSRCLGSSALASDRIYGWDARAGVACAIASGYFLWDALDGIVNFIDVGFAVHGVACFIVYIGLFWPFAAYYGVRFLMWEMTWSHLADRFLDKLNMTGSKPQMINGGFLLASFFGVRIVYGGVITVQFLGSLYERRHDITTLYLVIYSFGNVMLFCLNILWFTKMIAALRRRM